MRRMKDDEQAVLRSLATGSSFETVEFTRVCAILKTFRSHGFVDMDEELTARGRHVASKLLPVVTTEAAESADDPQAESKETELPIDHEEWGLNGIV